jgi:hypothetical protein
MSPRRSANGVAASNRRAMAASKALNAARQGEGRDRQVEEMGDSEPRDLEDDERYEHERI